MPQQCHCHSRMPQSPSDRSLSCSHIGEWGSRGLDDLLHVWQGIKDKPRTIQISQDILSIQYGMAEGQGPWFLPVGLTRTARKSVVRELTQRRMQGALVVLKLKWISSRARSGAVLGGSGEFSHLPPDSLALTPGAWKLYRSHIPSSKNAPTSVGKEGGNGKMRSLMLLPPTFQAGQVVSLFFFYFLGLPLRHVEVPKLGVELELQLQPLAYAIAIATRYLSHVCNLCHSSLGILNPLHESRDRTRIFMVPSRAH